MLKSQASLAAAPEARPLLLSELRSEERRVFTQQPPGHFSVLVAGREVDGIAIRDVSASGIRLEVAATLGVATHVRVRYRHGSLDLDLNGITCWEAPTDERSSQAHVVGIDLLTPTVLINIL